MNYKEWYLDVSLKIPCFVPIENGNIIIGLNHIGKCPGKCIGIMHEKGQIAVEKWISDNPNYIKEYKLKCN